MIATLLRPSFHFMFLIAACAASLGPSPTAVAGNWALVIGVGDYQDGNLLTLPYAGNDVDQLATVLVERGNYTPEHVARCIDNTCVELRQAIEDFIQLPKSEDQLLVYFSGHGYRTDGKLFLAPKDFTPEPAAEAAKSGIDVKWLRKRLDTCPAKSKILIIDSCHAGTENTAPATEIESAFSGIQGVVTLASSTAHEKSLVWEDNKQSLFTYWLVQALRGHADADMNGEITLDEAHNFVHRRVTSSATLLFGRRQTPVGSMGFGNTEGFPTLTKLKPQPLPVVLENIAQQIVWAVEDERLGPIISIPEFVFTSYEGVLSEREKRTLGTGSLGLRAAQEFHDMLNRYALGGTNVLSPDEVKRMLTGKTPTDVNSIVADNNSHEDNVLKPTVLVIGELLDRGDSIVHVRAKAIRYSNKSILLETGGVAELSDNEWVEQGYSIAARSADFDRRQDIDTGVYKSPASSAIESWNHPDRLRTHPMQDRSFPFRVSVRVRNPDNPKQTVERACKFHGNDAYVALDLGEEYVIQVHYDQVPNANTDGNVFLKLMVDGLGIRDQPVPPGNKANIKRLFAAKGIQVVSPRTNSLNHAKRFLLRPKEHSVRTWEFEGFYLGTELVCPFIVTDAATSLAADRGFTDNIGLITAAFYEELGTPRGGVGTKAGVPRVGRKIEIVPAGDIGRLLGAVHIHYVSTEAWRKLK